MSLPVSHIMRANVAFCEESTLLKKVAEIMINDQVGSILVNKGEESVGIITSNDLLRSVIKGLDFEISKAGDIMSGILVTCEYDEALDTILKKFEETGRSRIIVKKDGKVVGIIRRAVAERFKGFTGLYTFSPKTRSLPFRRGSGSTTS